MVQVQAWEAGEEQDLVTVRGLVWWVRVVCSCERHNCELDLFLNTIQL